MSLSLLAWDYFKKNTQTNPQLLALLAKLLVIVLDNMKFLQSAAMKISLFSSSYSAVRGLWAQLGISFWNPRGIWSTGVSFLRFVLRPGLSYFISPAHLLPRLSTASLFPGSGALPRVPRDVPNAEYAPDHPCFTSCPPRAPSGWRTCKFGLYVYAKMVVGDDVWYPTHSENHTYGLELKSHKRGSELLKGASGMWFFRHKESTWDGLGQEAELDLLMVYHPLHTAGLLRVSVITNNLE